MLKLYVYGELSLKWDSGDVMLKIEFYILVWFRDTAESVEYLIETAHKCKVYSDDCLFNWPRKRCVQNYSGTYISANHAL